MRDIAVAALGLRALYPLAQRSGVPGSPDRRVEVELAWEIKAENHDDNRNDKRIII